MIFSQPRDVYDKDYGQRQPRLVVFSVDIALDSYPEADSSRKSEYGNCVISYNDGITIDI